MSRLEVSAGGSPRPAGRKGVGEARFSGVRADLGAACPFDFLISRLGTLPLVQLQETLGSVQLGVHDNSRDVHGGEGQGRSKPLSHGRFRKFLQSQSPQPQLGPHEKSEVAGSRDLRGRPDARAAGKPGVGFRTSGRTRLGVWEAEAMARR